MKTFNVEINIPEKVCAALKIKGSNKISLEIKAENAFYCKALVVNALRRKNIPFRLENTEKHGYLVMFSIIKDGNVKNYNANSFFKIKVKSDENSEAVS